MQEYGICLQTLIALRNEPSETAEMVSQILFGEIYKLIDSLEKWVKIKLINDGYEGWIDKKLAYEIDATQKNQLDKLDKKKVNAAINFIQKENNKQLLPIVAGSEFHIGVNTTMQIDNKTYSIPEIEKLKSEINLHEAALQFLNAPYLWGGKSILGIDCSGLIQVVYKTQGIILPRDASEQAKLGNNISFISEAKTGDLAFFDNEDGDIIHVGMFLDSNTIIHASGWVRIDPIDHQGIYKTEEDKYSHKLRIIKRVIE